MYDITQNILFKRGVAMLVMANCSLLAVPVSGGKMDINLFTSRPKCIPGSKDPGITIVNPTEIPVMYGYIH